MALNITSENEDIKVETLNILIYGQPGVGKSSLGFTSNKCLILDFDKGSHRSAFRKDTVQIKSWSDVATITPNDLINYDTVVIDTVGRALDFLSQSIIAENPKNGLRNGALTLQGYGVLKASFTNWIKQLNILGKDVVFIAHDKEDKNGDQKFIRPDITGGSYNELMKVADFIGYYYMESNKRVLDFNPCEAFIGKNSAGLDKIFIPNFNQDPNSFANIIKIMKDTLNSRNSKQKGISNEINLLRNELEKVNDAIGINEFIATIKAVDLDPQVTNTIRALLLQKAKDLNLEMDKNTKLYYSLETKSAKEIMFEEQPEPLVVASLEDYNYV